MKKPIFLPLFAALLLASCQSDPITLSETPNEGVENPTEDEYCYAKIQVSMVPSAAGSSRGANGVVDQGLDSENEVKNAILVLFELVENEYMKDENYLFVNAINIELDAFNSVTSSNASPSSYQTIKLLKNLVIGDKVLLGMIIVNHNGLFEVTASNGLKLNGVEVASNTPLSTIKQSWASNTPGDFTGNGILMTNTLGIAANPGVNFNDQKMFTVMPFSTIYTYATESEALNGNLAYKAFIERVVAKVSVINSVPENSKVTTEGKVKTSLSYNIAGWKVINQKSSSYILRNWHPNPGNNTNLDWAKLASEINNESRFVLNSGALMSFDGNKYNLPQFSWCYGYGNDLENQYSPVDFANCGSANPQYCFENTFRVQEMKVKNATCALVKVQFKEGETAADLYRIGEDYANYFTAAELETEIKTRILSLYNTNNVFPGETGDLSCDSFTLETNAGHSPISDVNFTLTKNDNSTSTATWDIENNKSSLDALNAAIKIYRYKDGYAYYLVPIKHFGDELTPWKKGETPTPVIGSTVDNAYHIVSEEVKSNNNYLGRYGVVRNNSYEITISGVKQLGMASDCSVNTNDADNPYIGNMDTAIDYIESFMKAQINILPWAKRSDTVELQ